MIWFYRVCLQCQGSSRWVQWPCLDEWHGGQKQKPKKPTATTALPVTTVSWQTRSILTWLDCCDIIIHNSSSSCSSSNNNHKKEKKKEEYSCTTTILLLLILISCQQRLRQQQQQQQQQASPNCYNASISWKIRQPVSRGMKFIIRIATLTTTTTTIIQYHPVWRIHVVAI